MNCLVLLALAHVLRPGAWARRKHRPRGAESITFGIRDIEPPELGAASDEEREMWFTAAISSQFGVVRRSAPRRTSHISATFSGGTPAPPLFMCSSVLPSPPQMLETYAERRGRACSDAVDSGASARLPCLPLFCVFDNRRVSPHDTLAEARPCSLLR